MPDDLPEERPPQWPEQWAWTADEPPGHGNRDDRRWAVLTHLSVVPLAVPLAVVICRGHRSSYVCHQAVEALNFQITVALAVLLCSLLSVAAVGLLLVLVVTVAAGLLAVQAAVAANRGAWYRYPLSLRFLT